MEQVKIDRRTDPALITMDDIKKRLEERNLELNREHGSSYDEMALNMWSSNNQSRTSRKGTKKGSLEEDAPIVEIWAQEG